jgi:Protein of unknown function (DUF4238)
MGGLGRPSARRCSAIDGNTNRYLSDPRAVEAIIRPIESGYARAVAQVESSNILPDSIVVLAGWITYVETSSPAAMRLGAAMLSPLIEETAKHVESLGDLPPAPPELGGKSLSELLSSGEVKVNVDPKYPQAMGVAGFLDRVRAHSNCRWHFLHNDHSDSPFFTSDYPIVAEPAGAPHLFNKVVPLSPTIAVRLIAWMDPREVREAQALSNFKYVIRSLKRNEVRDVNTMIVRAAENIVIYRDPRDWVLPFVRKHAAFRTESRTDRLGPYVITRRLIEKTSGDPGQT